MVINRIHCNMHGMFKKKLVNMKSTYKIFLHMYMCGVYVCAHSHICRDTHVCMPIWRLQALISNVIIDHTSLYILRQSLSVEP